MEGRKWVCKHTTAKQKFHNLLDSQFPFHLVIVSAFPDCVSEESLPSRFPNCMQQLITAAGGDNCLPFQVIMSDEWMCRLPSSQLVNGGAPLHLACSKVHLLDWGAGRLFYLSVTTRQVNQHWADSWSFFSPFFKSLNSSVDGQTCWYEMTRRLKRY